MQKITILKGSSKAHERYIIFCRDACVAISDISCVLLSILSQLTQKLSWTYFTSLASTFFLQPACSPGSCFLTWVKHWNAGVALDFPFQGIPESLSQSSSSLYFISFFPFSCCKVNLLTEILMLQNIYLLFQLPFLLLSNMYMLCCNDF